MVEANPFTVENLLKERNVEEDEHIFSVPKVIEILSETARPTN